MKIQTVRSRPAPDSGRTVKRNSPRPMVRLAPTPQMARAIRVLIGSTAATEAELWAARRTLAIGLGKLALRNNAYARALDLALIVAQSSEWGELGPINFDLGPSLYGDAKGAVGGFFRALRGDVRWVRIDGPNAPAAPNRVELRDVPRGQGYPTGSGTLLAESGWPNGLLQQVSGYWYANYAGYSPIYYYRGQAVRDWSKYQRFRSVNQQATAPDKPVFHKGGADPVVYSPTSISSTVGLQLPPVPHYLAAQVVRWRELVAPRPDGLPIREYPAPLPSPSPAPRPVQPPSWSLQFGPSGKPRPAERHQYRPPPKGTKERKVKTTMDVALRVASAATEAVDVIDAVYYALPAHMRVKNATPQTKLLLIYRNVNSLDLPAAIRNIVLTQLMDVVSAKASKPLRTALDTHLGTKAPSQRPWFYGPV